jgi:hypothetical protein
VPAQDDAGSGADAPDACEAGLVLAPGAYAGALGGLGGRLGDARALDGNDWYRFAAAAGDLVTVTLAPAPADAPRVLFELRRPDGALAAWQEAAPGTPRVLAVAADAPGLWGLRATLAAGAAPYAFTLATGAPDGFVAAAAGPGAFALGVTLGPGGRLEAEVVVHYATRQAPARSDVLLLRAPGEPLYATSRPTSGLAQGPDGARVQAGGSDVEVRAQARDGLVQRVVVPVDLRGPGTFHVLVLTHAAEAYAWARVARVTDGVLLGATHSPLHALEPGDFAPAAGASTSNAEATLRGEATLTFHARPIGSFDCGQPEASACAMTPPGGAPGSVVATYLTDGPSGAWTFTRESAVNAGWNPFPLFVADVTLAGDAAAP